MTDRFFINGEWVLPESDNTAPVIDPATEEVTATVAMGEVADAEKALNAARDAFPGFSRTSREERLSILENLLNAYERHYDEMADTIRQEMGAPITLSRQAQAACGRQNIASTIDALRKYEFRESIGTTAVFKAPVGVCGLITPWNWPINQITCKVAPALAAGCTMVLKPSINAPLSGLLFARICQEAGVPAGVFNLLNGKGSIIGQSLSSSRNVDMVSITGSTGAGASVAAAAAPTIKRVCQELGGKSANIILADASLETAVTSGTLRCLMNSGQTCTAPTRMLVPVDLYDRALEISEAVAADVVVGPPELPETTMGPLANHAQFEKVRHMIELGVSEGATLVIGGPEMPDGIDRGYFVRPTVFGGVSNDMTIAREEIFGPVLCVMPYGSEQEAIRMANDSDYGLSGAVWSGDLDHARAVAQQLRTGAVHINGAPVDFNAPFGGFKQSGNGRERGTYGIDEYVEIQAIMGYDAA